MMKKNRILAALCSLVFAMNCSACGRDQQEVLLIGQQGISAAEGQEIMSGEGASNAQQNETIYEETQVQEICVYVCGAVRNPGVFFLAQGSRVADALAAAGGFTEDAELGAVNLAARISDGEKWYFPTHEEFEEQGEQASVGPEAASDSGLININTAGPAQLCTLPGIGESKAADIIAYREAHGDFTACEDIMQVPGIKENIYIKISDKITVK